MLFIGFDDNKNAVAVDAIEEATANETAAVHHRRHRVEAVLFLNQANTTPASVAGQK
jgi:hypothetical protein